jgi:hypothetical protein
VSVLGERDDQINLMRDAHLGWVVADGDTGAYGILDLMALAIPTVASEGGVAQRYIAHGISGALYPPDDSATTAATGSAARSATTKSPAAPGATSSTAAPATTSSSAAASPTNSPAASAPTPSSAAPVTTCSSRSTTKSTNCSATQDDDDVLSGIEG